MTKVFRHTLIYAIGNILPKAASFILLPIYTKYLTPGDYGIINSVELLQKPLLIFFMLGLDASIFRLIYDYKDEERKTFLSTIFITVFFSSTIITGLLFIFNNEVEKIYKAIEFFPYFLFPILTTYVGSYFILPKKLMMINEKPQYFVFWSLVQFILSAGFILFFIIELKDGAIGLLRAKLIAALIIFPAFLYFIYKNINFKFSFKILKHLLSFSLPIIPFVISGWVLDFSDRIFLERYLTLHDVGIYSLSYTIAGVSFLVSSSLDQAYRPLYFKFANLEDQNEGYKLIFKFNSLIFIVIIAFSFMISFVGKELIGLFLDNKYFDSYLYLPIILLSNIFVVACGIITRFFEQSEKTKQNMVIYIFATILNLLLNYFLIQRWGIYGAAFATIISFFSVFIISYFYTKKYCFFVPFDWKRIIPVLITSIILVFFSQYASTPDLLISLIIKCFIILVFLLFFLFKYKNLLFTLIHSKQSNN